MLPASSLMRVTWASITGFRRSTFSLVTREEHHIEYPQQDTICYRYICYHHMNQEDMYFGGAFNITHIFDIWIKLDTAWCPILSTRNSLVATTLLLNLSCSYRYVLLLLCQIIVIIIVCTVYIIYTIRFVNNNNCNGNTFCICLYTLHTVIAAGILGIDCMIVINCS